MGRTSFRCGVSVWLALAAAGCARKPAEPDPRALCESLRSTDPATRGTATRDLISVGKPAVPHVLGVLADHDPAVRLAAVNVLWGMGARGTPVVLALATALADADVTVRMEAAKTLAALGPDARDAVPALVKALRDSEGTVRLRAVQGLGEIGAEAVSALPALERQLKNEYLGSDVAEAIRKINTDAAARGTGPAGPRRSR